MYANHLRKSCTGNLDAGEALAELRKALSSFESGEAFLSVSHGSKNRTNLLFKTGELLKFNARCHVQPHHKSSRDEQGSVFNEDRGFL